MRPHWLDRPQNVRLIRRGSLGVLALTVLAEAVIALHPHFRVEALFGFHAWLGLLSCAAMIVAAKVLGVVLKRPDTYYDADRDE